MSRRYKSSTMKFGVPLSVPGSRYVEYCYGMHGKGYGGCPPRNSTIELILLNAQRQLWRVEGYFPDPHKYVTEAVALTENTGNRIGRITPDGVIMEFSAGITPNARLYGITAGPDGNIWFTEQLGNQIGRITQDGVVTEFFDHPTHATLQGHRWPVIPIVAKRTVKRGQSRDDIWICSTPK